MQHIKRQKYCTTKHRNTARSSTESRQNASNVAAIGGNQAGGGSCQWECQEEPTANLELVPTLKTLEKFITKKGHLKYSNYASQNKIDRGSLFTRCHLTGEEENQHLGVVSRSSRRSLSSGSGTACQKSGLSPLPPRALCTSPKHLPAT